MADQSVSSIFETTKYRQFKVLKQNRMVYQTHVDRLKKDMEKSETNFSSISPLIVDKNFRVLDGQHRLQALKELGWPVFYMIAPNGKAEDARNINVTHKQWRPLDYARSYSEAGNVNYVRYLQLYSEYPEMMPTILAGYVMGRKVPGLTSLFRKGLMTISSDQMDETRDRLNRLYELMEIAPELKTGEMNWAILNMFNVPGYDHERMLEQLAKAKNRADIEIFARRNDNLRTLESIYNRGIRSKPVRFF